MKKIVWIIAILGLSAVIGGTVFGVVKANSGKTTFTDNGSVLLGDGSGEAKSVGVNNGAAYTVSKGGVVKLVTADGKVQMLPSKSFTILDNGGVVAFEDGVILNFDDMSDNFINNYLVPAGMEIEKNGSGYMASTTNGSINFGDHIWKLDDNKYMIRSPELSVYFADGDERQVKDYIQIYISDDGIVHILTPENEWTTISEECYIRTSDGTIIRPLTQRVEKDNYKLSLAGLSVTAEDNIELTEDEMRRQIVPEIKITTIDGESGKSGTDGTSGEDGISGSDGRNGDNGQDGTDGEDGAEGTAGTTGNSGSSGNTGGQGTKGANGTDGISAADGTPGVAGITGNAGALGEEGEEGNKGGSGTDGTSGTNGNKGTAGNTGSDGKGGIDGDDGDDGDDGNKGETGGSGTKGSDASSITTVNSQLPAMSFGEITITDTGIRGSIIIDDPSKMLANLYVDPTEVDKFTAAEKAYAGEVIIYDNATGEQIVVYPYKGKDQAIEDKPNFYKYFSVQNSEGHTVYFGLNADDPAAVNVSKRLTPDTSYTIEVNAYYSSQTSGDKKTAYRRTFLSRQFYTDSAGVILTKNKVYESSEGRSEAEINVVLAQGTDKSHLTADVYLLTPDQNSNFSLTSKSSPNAYCYRYSMNYTNNTYNGYHGSYVYTDAAGSAVQVVVGNDVSDQTITNPDQQKLLMVPTSFEESSGAPLAGNTEYIVRVVINNNGVEALSPQELEFTTLKAKPYTQKHQSKDGGGLEIIDVAIKDAVPSVNFNRVSGAFEVSKPIVVDPDNSIKSYVYKAYLNGGTEPCATKEVTVGAVDPVEFFLATGSENKYTFRIEFKTDNGEAEVIYETKESEQVQGLGSTLPSLTFEGTTTFNSVAGKFTMSMGSGTGIKVDNNHPLWLEIYGDQKYENKILYEGQADAHGKRSNTGKCDNSDTDGHCLTNPCTPDSTCGCDWWISTTKTYAISMNSIVSGTGTVSGVNTNSIQFSMVLKDLYENHKYTVKVSGYARMTENANMSGEDGTGYQFTELGSFTFRTLEPQAVTMSWDPQEGTTSKLNVVVKLTTANSYELDEIRKGQVAIELLDGNGSNGNVLGTKWINTTTELAALTGMNKSPGLTLTENSFSNVKLTEGATYTLKVSEISDETYNLDTTSNGVNNYTNYFNSIINQTEVLAAKASPPDLTANPQSAVRVKAIPNRDASLLGYQKNENLSDDAIIGYTMDAEYDNVSHLGYKVRYYAFEYNDFYDCLSGTDTTPGKDPVGNYLTDQGEDISDQVGIRKLITLNRTFERSANSIPGVAVIFDDLVTEPTTDEDARSYAYNGSTYYVYHVNPLRTKTETVMVGDVPTQISYKQGMSRGYRYVFAYTMEYSDPETTDAAKVYPYKHSDYESFKENYGIGFEGKDKRFLNVAYILNSGMRSAPKDTPVINTYITDAVPTFQMGTDLDASVSQGTATMHYTYKDPDGTLKPGASAFSYINKQQKEGGGWKEYTEKAELKAIVPDEETGDLPWETVNLKFVTTRKSNTAEPDMILPRAQYSLYAIDYSKVLTAYNYDPDATDIAFGSAAPDFDWDGYLAEVNKDGVIAPEVSIHSQAAALNYIDFVFNLDSDATKAIISRAYAAIVTASSEDGTKSTQITKKLQGDGINSVYVRIGTGELADVGTGSIRFSVQVLYDNGDSGWNLVTSPNGFGISLSKMEENGTLTRGGYYVNSDNTSELPFGGIFSTLSGTQVPDFANMVNKKLRQATNYNYALFDSPYKKYIYPFIYGVDGSGTSTKMGTADSMLLSPKSVASTSTLMSGSGKVDVEVILPTLFYQNYESWTTSVYFRAGTTATDLRVAGFDTAVPFDKTNPAQTVGAPDSLSNTYYIVHCGLFDGNHENEAKVDGNLYDTSKGWYQDSQGKDRVIHLVFDQNGRYWGTCDTTGSLSAGTFQASNFVQTTYNAETKNWSNLAAIEELNEEGKAVQSYYATFFMDFQNEETLAYSQRIIIDAENSATSSPKSSYLVQTSKGVTVQIQNNKTEYEKNNNSYFDKSATMLFSLSPRAYGITMMYDIYETMAKASTDERDPNPYLNLNDETIKGYLLTVPSQLANTDNSVSINLSPDMILKLNKVLGTGKQVGNLKPGKTYYLRATAYASGQQQGYSVVPITVKKSTFGAAVGMNGRTQDSINFTVTISDQQHVAMGFKYESTAGKSLDPDPTKPKYNNKGLYTVRFTDKNGKLISTKYDNYVFSFEDLQQEFVLGETTVLQADTEYFCNIYAVMDLELDGLSASVTGNPYDSTSYKDWRYFFGDVADAGHSGSASGINGWTAPTFTSLINSLWDTNGNKKTGEGYEQYDRIRDAFLVESRSRKTAPAEGGINIPAGKDYLDGAGNSFVFTVKESYGVVTLNAQQQQIQGFDSIEWSIQTDTGKRYTGSAYKEDGDPMFEAELEEGALNGTFKYYLNLDEDEVLPGVEYEVSIVLKKDPTAQLPQGIQYSYSYVYLKE